MTIRKEHLKLIQPRGHSRRKAKQHSVQDIADEFPHQGIVHLADEKKAPSISWKEGPGGEIKFQIDNQGNMLSFTELFRELKHSKEGGDYNETDQLNVVNQLLAHYRPHAVPDRNGYHAASAGLTLEGKLFISSNNEKYIKHPFAGRGCSETATLKEAQEALANKDVQFQHMYLMSGIARKKNRQFIYNDGEVSCLCGECRQNLRYHIARGGEFIMVPTNDGKTPLTLAEAPSASDLELGQAWRIPRQQMYPLPEYKRITAEEHPEVHKVVDDGFRYITNLEAPVIPLKTQMSDLAERIKSGDTSSETMSQLQQLVSYHEHVDTQFEALRDNPSITNVNRAMLQMVKKAYATHAEELNIEQRGAKGKDKEKNIEITVILIKTKKGEYYPSIAVNGSGWLPSKPPEMPMALANAFNQRNGIDHIYMMTFNDKQIREELVSRRPAKTVYSVKMPDPAAIGRLIKNLPKGQDSWISALPINNGELTEEELQALIPPPISVRESFGPDYMNPKRALAEGAVLQ